MSPRYKSRVRITGGFWLLIAWFWWANGWRLLATVLLAAAVHEAGHLLMLRLLGVGMESLRVSVFGAEIRPEGTYISYGGELAALLAGPAANLLCGMALALSGSCWLVPAGAHLTLGCFNLLPIRPLDGGRALYLLVSWLAGPAAGEWAARCIGVSTAIGLGVFLAWLMWRSGGSLWLLPALLGLLLALVGELRGNRSFL